MTTDAPRATSAREVAKPIPRPPPVTSATLPLRSYRAMGLTFSHARSPRPRRWSVRAVSVPASGGQRDVRGSSLRRRVRYAGGRGNVTPVVAPHGSVATSRAARPPAVRLHAFCDFT